MGDTDTDTDTDAALLPITDHFDGFLPNDRLTIERDARDPKAGNASHRYQLVLKRLHPEETGGEPHGQEGDHENVGYLTFQHGPRNEPGSTPGILEPALVAVLLDRYRGFQAGPYSCRENAIVITKLEEALLWMKKRAFDRAAQGVLGKNVAHTAAE